MCVFSTKEMPLDWIYLINFKTFTSSFLFASLTDNSMWVRALPGPMHLGLKTGPLCPIFCTKLKEPYSFNKVPDGPYI